MKRMDNAQGWEYSIAIIHTLAPEDFPEKVAQLASKVDVGVKDMKIE